MDWIRAMAGARALVDACLGVKPGEQVGIITDTTTVRTAEILGAAVHERGAEVVLCVMTPRRGHGENPPAGVAALMSAVDALLMPAKWSLTHSEARRQANKAGVRILSLPGYDEDALRSEALQADFRGLAPLVRRVAELLSKADTVRITSELGTDLTLSVAGRTATFQNGTALEGGQWGAPPCIEATVAPLEGTTNGTLVVDGAIIPGGIVGEPVRVTFVDGGIVAVEGGPDATAFLKYLAQYREPEVRQAVELGVALNPGARLERNMLEAEGEYGTVHVGLGEGRSFGSSISAPVHLDLVVRKPVLELDGVVVVKDKQVLVDVE